MSGQLLDLGLISAIAARRGQWLRERHGIPVLRDLSNRCHQGAADSAATDQNTDRYCLRTEADLLNVALFGMTALQWRQANPDEQGNMRDVATLWQLVVLSNLESINAVLIRQGLTAPERLAQLNSIAITQMRSLVGMAAIQQLGKTSEQ